MLIKVKSTIKLCGKEYTLTGSMIAMETIENSSGIGTIGILEKFSRGLSTLTDLSAVIYGGIYGTHHEIQEKCPLGFSEVKELVFKHGFMSDLQFIAVNFLNAILVPEKENKKESTVSDAGKEEEKKS